jgi:hypothetical protein
MRYSDYEKTLIPPGHPSTKDFRQLAGLPTLPPSLQVSHFSKEAWEVHCFLRKAAELGNFTSRKDEKIARSFLYPL